MSSESPVSAGFGQFGFSKPITRALEELGYKEPTPVQLQAIPIVLQGQDILGQAQTGTGKTGAFALPLLERLNPKVRQPQILVLAPTRELAGQVAGAFEQYSSFMSGVEVVAVYGGAPMGPQFRMLERGAQIVVGTPGRIMDHLRRGSLKLDALSCFVLDEADEMLRMGFIDDVQWIAEQIPNKCQRALFSATMPPVVRKIAQNHLNRPKHVTIETRTCAATTIGQRFLRVPGFRKTDALARIIEAEDMDALLVFARTRSASQRVTDELQQRGLSCAALNGDIAQNQRERTVENLRRGHLKVIVATDVAARGLDVERISHVVNYDMPQDVETYIHRIGRTGRAGREGQAISLVSNQDLHMMSRVCKVTGKQVEEMRLPSIAAVNRSRVARFEKAIDERFKQDDSGYYEQVIADYIEKQDRDPVKVAAVVAHMLHYGMPLQIEEDSVQGFDADVKREKDTAERTRDKDSRSGSRGRRRQRFSQSRSKGQRPPRDRSDRGPKRGKSKKNRSA